MTLSVEKSEVQVAVPQLSAADTDLSSRMSPVTLRRLELLHRSPVQELEGWNFCECDETAAFVGVAIADIGKAVKLSLAMPR
jgi:hypothetical protein